jgi:hypothetical protein
MGRSWHAERRSSAGLKQVRLGARGMMWPGVRCQARNGLHMEGEARRHGRQRGAAVAFAGG